MEILGRPPPVETRAGHLEIWHSHFNGGYVSAGSELRIRQITDVRVQRDGHTRCMRTLLPPTIDLRVAGARRETDRVVVLSLVAADHGPLPAWMPGAHIDLHLPNGTTRQYSLISDPADQDSWRIAVQREDAGRGSSKFIHDTVYVGTRVRSGYPRNSFPLTKSSEVVLIAGGIGITPILPMARELAAAGRRWSLLYLGRDMASMALRGEVCLLGDAVTVWANEERGWLDIGEVATEALSRGAEIFCCGPQGMLDDIHAAADRSRSAHRVHSERFGASGGLTGSPFEIELASSGASTVVSGDQTILEALDELGVYVPSACQIGVCGSCVTSVVDGVPQHLDSVLTRREQAAGDRICVCVSRCTSGKLVLDL